MKKILIFILISLFYLSGYCQQKEQRVALVIGNSAYKKMPLKNPVNDAKDIANRLRSLGFTVVERSNLGIRQIGGALREFKSKLSPGSVAVVYYAGHGLQIKGENFLPAVDAEIAGEEDVQNQSLSIRQILDLLSDSKSKLNLVFLDACRDNPFASAFRSSSRGLARDNIPTGTLISYATKPGSVAADGEGRNGLYTSALLTSMNKVDVPIESMLKTIVASVKNASNGNQEPWVEGNIDGEFCFGTCASLSIAQNSNPTNVSEREDKYWDDVKNTGNKEAFEAYIEAFPSGRYIGLARANILRLSNNNQNLPSVSNIQVETIDKQKLIEQVIKKADIYDIYKYFSENKNFELTPNNRSSLLGVYKKMLPQGYYFDTTVNGENEFHIIPQSITLLNESRITVGILEKNFKRVIIFSRTTGNLKKWVIDCKSKSSAVYEIVELEDGKPTTKVSTLGNPEYMTLSANNPGSIISGITDDICSPLGLNPIIKIDELKSPSWNYLWPIDDTTKVYFNKNLIFKSSERNTVILKIEYTNGKQIKPIVEPVFISLFRYKVSCSEPNVFVDIEYYNSKGEITYKSNPHSEKDSFKPNPGSIAEQAKTLACTNI